MHKKLIDDFRSSLGNSTCANCGRPFQCGVEAGKSQCWCFGVEISEDIRNKMSSFSECLCKECLTKRGKDERSNGNV